MRTTLPAAMHRRALLLTAVAAITLRHAVVRAELVANTTLPETQCTGAEAPGESCWVASSTWPRQCDCVRNVCPSASIAETTNCFICDRGEALRRATERGGVGSLLPPQPPPGGARPHARHTSRRRIPSPILWQTSAPLGCLSPAPRIWNICQRGGVYGQ